MPARVSWFRIMKFMLLFSKLQNDLTLTVRRLQSHFMLFVFLLIDKYIYKKHFKNTPLRMVVPSPRKYHKKHKMAVFRFVRQAR